MVNLYQKGYSFPFGPPPMNPSEQQFLDARELRRFRLLYTVYPQIRESVSPQLSPVHPDFGPEQADTFRRDLRTDYPRN